MVNYIFKTDLNLPGDNLSSEMYPVDGNMEVSSGFRRGKTDLRREEDHSPKVMVAPFNQLDWKAVESKLMKQPLQVDQIRSPKFYSGKDVDWGKVLPQLRKSLRDLDPKQMNGSIWPQPQEPISVYQLPQSDRSIAQSRQCFQPNYAKRQRWRSPLRNSVILQHAQCTCGASECETKKQSELRRKVSSDLEKPKISINGSYKATDQQRVLTLSPSRIETDIILEPSVIKLKNIEHKEDSKNKKLFPRHGSLQPSSGRQYHSNLLLSKELVYQLASRSSKKHMEWEEMQLIPPVGTPSPRSKARGKKVVLKQNKLGSGIKVDASNSDLAQDLMPLAQQRYNDRLKNIAARNAGNNMVKADLRMTLNRFQKSDNAMTLTYQSNTVVDYTKQILKGPAHLINARFSNQGDRRSPLIAQAMQLQDERLTLSPTYKKFTKVGLPLSPRRARDNLGTDVQNSRENHFDRTMSITTKMLGDDNSPISPIMKQKIIDSQDTSLQKKNLNVVIQKTPQSKLDRISGGFEYAGRLGADHALEPESPNIVSQFSDNQTPRSHIKEQDEKNITGPFKAKLIPTQQYSPFLEAVKNLYDESNNENQKNYLKRVEETREEHNFAAAIKKKASVIYQKQSGDVTHSLLHQYENSFPSEPELENVRPTIQTSKFNQKIDPEDKTTDRKQEGRNSPDDSKITNGAVSSLSENKRTSVLAKKFKRTTTKADKQDISMFQKTTQFIEQSGEIELVNRGQTYGSFARKYTKRLSTQEAVNSSKMQTTQVSFPSKVTQDHPENFPAAPPETGFIEGTLSANAEHHMKVNHARMIREAQKLHTGDSSNQYSMNHTIYIEQAGSQGTPTNIRKELSQNDKLVGASASATPSQIDQAVGIVDYSKISGSQKPTVRDNGSKFSRIDDLESAHGASPSINKKSIDEFMANNLDRDSFCAEGQTQAARIKIKSGSKRNTINNFHRRDNSSIGGEIIESTDSNDDQRNTINNSALGQLNEGPPDINSSVDHSQRGSPREKTAQLSIQLMNPFTTIPDIVRLEAVAVTDAVMGMRPVKNQKEAKITSTYKGSIKHRQQVVGELSPKQKSKKVEHISKILDRVVRANCCLQPQNPESKELLVKAVGDGSQYFNQPSHKAYAIRMKFLRSNFCQSVTEDFIAVQNLDRNIDATIVTTKDFFKMYEISGEEKQLMVRLFKRLFYRTIEHKYGYLKSKANDKAEISGRILCQELELNPKILKMYRIITTFGSDAMVSWINFNKILSVFLLNKDCLTNRLEFLLRFIGFNKDLHILVDEDYLRERVDKFQFTKRQVFIFPEECQELWDKVRHILWQHRDQVFQLDKQPEPHFNELYAIKVLTQSKIQAEQTHSFFELLFEIN